MEGDLAQLNVPTLVVWGDNDMFFDVRWAYWLRDTIPGVTEVVLIPNAKLFFPHERADALAPHLHRHWTGAREDPIVCGQLTGGPRQRFDSA